MGRRAVLIAAAVALGFAYIVAWVYVVGLSAAFPTPTWWVASLPKSVSPGLLWVTVTHLLGTVLVSLPFAWVIGRVYARLGIALSLLITATMVVWVEIPAMSGFSSVGTLLQTVWLLGAFVLLIALPVEVWAFQRHGPLTTRSSGRS
jgi:hypothetical protein